MIQSSGFNIFATACFFLAILHTFLVKRFEHIARKFPEGSVGENFFHLIGEVEVVMGFWAGLFLIGSLFLQGTNETIHYLNSRNFTEPAFVFVIMTICATRPILKVAEWFIQKTSSFFPFPKMQAFYLSTLTFGPLLGSFITEPAAMTVTALILKKAFYDRGLSRPLQYATLGLLFVNISIGGTLTPYAAPPVLMVAQKWGWGLHHMLGQFGWKAAVGVFLSSLLVTLIFRKELQQLGEKNSPQTKENSKETIPLWVIASHLLMLVLIVITSHYLTIFIGLFLFFLGLATVTREYQDELKLRESLLVAFFLGGLVVLGGPQHWWLQPLLSQLSTTPLFIGSMALTAITDNAALTYLGSLVSGLSDISKYALVAGAVTGGGLTVIANAPNPAGYGILNSSFGPEGISPLGLFAAALGPTLIAALVFWFLPSF